MSIDKRLQYKFLPLSRENWPDLEQLFGEKGACGGCWCMYWRLNNITYEAGKGNTNKQRLMKLVESDAPLGVIAYSNDKPVGWCSASPRESLERLKTSRYFKPIDDAEVWSISCLYILPEQRRKGLSAQLIREACLFARDQGAKIIESYPIVPVSEKVPEVFAWVGFAETFKQVGFIEVRKPSKLRSYMRYYVDH